MEKSKKAFDEFVRTSRVLLVCGVRGDDHAKAGAEEDRKRAMFELRDAVMNELTDRFVQSVQPETEPEPVNEVPAGTPEDGLDVPENTGTVPKRKRGRRIQVAALVAKPKKSAKRGGGEKRSPGELAVVMKQLKALVTKQPGLRMEQIGESLGLPTKELALPARKLIAEKSVKTKGQKRATTYWAR